ncbi:MAG: DUF1573 domain-containing protein, partial [Sediminibacterium sp.]
MRKIFLVLVVCFFVGNADAQTAAAPPKNIDKMVAFTNLDYDMGKIVFGVPLEYNVTIKNISKDTVVLKDVVAGCGCTTPKFRSGEKILPGKSTYITLGFNGSVNGDFIRTVDIFFNDGSQVKQAKFHGVATVDSTTVKQAVN